jgi:hypothetical protein
VPNSDRSPEQGWPPVHVDTYAALRPKLQLVRVMYRFLHEVIATDPELKPHYNRILLAYADLLQKELAPLAYDMATMLLALEDEHAAKSDSR